MNDTTNTSSERESKDQVKNDDRLEADDGSRAEKIAAFIAEHQIDVPEGAPAPFLTFAEAPFPKRLTQALLKQGYESPSPIQAQAWPIALSGKDIVAVAKTGSGKTCGFLLPALCRVGRRRRRRGAGDGDGGRPQSRPAAVTPSAIVLAPTRELAIQIGDECLKFCPAAGAKVVTLYGGASKGDQLRARARAPTWWRLRPGGSTIFWRRRLVFPRPCARRTPSTWCWTRQTACWTWASSRRSERS